KVKKHRRTLGCGRHQILEFSERRSAGGAAAGGRARGAPTVAPRKIRLAGAAASSGQSASEEKRARVERELRTRVDGIAHARRRRRLYAERRHGSSALLHGLDD